MALMMLLRRGTFARCVPLAVVYLLGAAAAAQQPAAPRRGREYIEVPGSDHGTVIGSHQAEIFPFFAKHSR
jgi:hypothetical protein